jgi:hypothetical protein
MKCESSWRSSREAEVREVAKLVKSFGIVERSTFSLEYPAVESRKSGDFRYDDDSRKLHSIAGDSVGVALAFSEFFVSTITFPPSIRSKQSANRSASSRL